MIARLLRIGVKLAIKRTLRHGAPGSNGRLAARAKARSAGSPPTSYRGLARRDVASGALPVPPGGADPWSGCPPGWGYADYVDGSVACLPPIDPDIRRRARVARRR